MSVKNSAISGLALFPLFLGLLPLSCNKHNAAGPARISEISPMEGPGGTTIVIKGSGFSDTPDLDSVYFNGKAATISSADDNMLLVTVPQLAGSGKVSVKVNTTTTMGPCFTYDYQGVVTTYAGTPGSSGANNGSITSATFDFPCNIAVDASGNLYVADAYNNMIRMITPGGTVSTLIKTPDNPYGVALDGKGNLDVSLYTLILQVSLSTGKITTLSGTNLPGFANSPIGKNASFDNPEGLAVDKSGNVYVADAGNSAIRLVTPTGATSTFSGVPSTFHHPSGLVFDAAGNCFIADTHNEMIRKITPGGTVSTLAGNGNPGYSDGVGPAAGFDSPAAITIDSKGNLYVADENNNVIRMITPAGAVTTIAGNGDVGSADGVGAAASFNAPQGITCDANGNLWVADTENNRIRKITLQ